MSYFRGLDSARSKLKRALIAVDTSMDSTLLEVATDVQSRARIYAPMQTGTLRDSIQIRPWGKHSLKITAEAHNERTGYDYAPIQHNNTSYRHSVGGSLYLKRAVDECADEFVQKMKDGVGL